MDWLAFVGSILGGLIGGIFTFLGVKINIKHDEKRAAQERINKINQEKPRLEILSYVGFRNANENQIDDSDCNALALAIVDFKYDGHRSYFFYNEEALDINNLVYVEYKFINNGLTEIEDICVTSDLQRYMSLIALETKDVYIKKHLLNYDVWSNKRYIKPKDLFVLRVFYVKDQVPSTIMGAPELVVWLKDVNGHIWKQILYAPEEEIHMPHMGKTSELKESIDIKKSIECFKNPIMW